MTNHDLTAYGPIPHGPGYGTRRRDRLARIREDFPSVTMDAHEWLQDDDRFVRLVRDMIRTGLADPRAIGPRSAPTPDQARAEWTRLVTAATGQPPQRPETPPWSTRRRPPREAAYPWDVEFGDASILAGRRLTRRTGT